MAASLTVTAVVALLYLLVVRLLDFNEKEPLWAVLMLFGGGAVAAASLVLFAPGAFLALNPLVGNIASELARFLAVGAGIGVLVLVGRSKGYSEVNGLLDGVVYGSAGGFGFATGLAFTREILLPTPKLPLTAAGMAGYGEIALVGLSDGLFGALMGIGFAAALDARSHAKRAVVGVGGLLAAIAAHLLYDALAKGAPFSDSAMVRKWAALLLPVLVVIATVIVALRFEKGAIAEELSSEAETGAVSPEELGVLQSWAARQGQYVSRLAKLDLGGWSALHSLHNRQVQLALAKRKVAKETDQQARAESAGEVVALRRSVLELKQRLGAKAPSDGQEASS